MEEYKSHFISKPRKEGGPYGHFSHTWKLPKGNYKIYIFFFASGPIILHQSPHSCSGNQELHHTSMLFYLFWAFWATFTSEFPSNVTNQMEKHLTFAYLELKCCLLQTVTASGRTRIGFSIGSSGTYTLGLNTKSGWQHLWSATDNRKYSFCKIVNHFLYIYHPAKAQRTASTSLALKEKVVVFFITGHRPSNVFITKTEKTITIHICLITENVSMLY